MRCCALTKEKWKRCSKQTSFIFCKQHRKGWWLRVASFIFISVPTFFFLYKQIYNEFPFTKSTSIIKRLPVFSPTDSRFKILILPFDKECDYNGAKYDIGSVISKRLENLNKQDTLNLICYYLTDSIDFSNFSSEKADSIRKYHHADQIVYGSYSLKECEGNTSDKICFNYRIDQTKYPIEEKQINESYQMISISGLDQIRNGKGQEDIDYIIYYIAGISSLKKENPKKALKLFKKIIAYDKDLMIQISVGSTYVILKDNSKAETFFDKAYENSKIDDEALVNLSHYYLEQKNYLKVKKYLEKAVKIDSSNDIAWNNLGSLYLFIFKDSLNGKMYFERALKLNSNNDMAWGNLGLYYANTKRYQKAKEYLLKSIEINNDNYKSLFILGTVFMNLGDYPSARFYFEKCAQINPSNETLWGELARSYISSQDFKNAIKVYLKAVEVMPNQAQVWYNQIGFCFANVNDYLTAETYFVRSLEIDSNFVGALNNLGNCYKELKDSINALKVFEKTIKIDPNRDTSWYNLAIFYWEFKNYVEAKKCFERALKINPRQPDPLYALASIYSIQRNRQKTYLYLQKSIGLEKSLKVSAKSDSTFQWLWDEVFFNSITQ